MKFNENIFVAKNCEESGLPLQIITNIFSSLVLLKLKCQSTPFHTWLDFTLFVSSNILTCLMLRIKIDGFNSTVRRLLFRKLHAFLDDSDKIIFLRSYSTISLFQTLLCKSNFWLMEHRDQIEGHAILFGAAHT